MQIALIILSVGLLGVILYFAFSPKSGRLLKLCSLIALGLIALSIVVCGVFLIKGPSEDPDAVLLPVFAEASPQAKETNTPAFLGFLAVFLFILAMIVVIALRGQRKAEQAAADKSKKSPARPDAFERENPAPGLGDADAFPDEEESFDIDFN